MAASLTHTLFTEEIVALHPPKFPLLQNHLIHTFIRQRINWQNVVSDFPKHVFSQPRLSVV